MAVVVVATFRAKRGREAEGEAVLRRVIEQTHAHEPVEAGEPGKGAV